MTGPLSEAIDQAKMKRNEMGCPVRADGSLDVARHDEELAASSSTAERMIAELARHPELEHAAGAIEVLHKGHVPSAEHVKAICKALDVTLVVRFLIDDTSFQLRRDRLVFELYRFWHYANAEHSDSSDE